MPHIQHTTYISFIWYIASEFIHLQQIYLEYRLTSSIQKYIRSKRFKERHFKMFFLRKLVFHINGIAVLESYMYREYSVLEVITFYGAPFLPYFLSLTVDKWKFHLILNLQQNNSFDGNVDIFQQHNSISSMDPIEFIENVADWNMLHLDFFSLAFIFSLAFPFVCVNGSFSCCARSRWATNENDLLILRRKFSVHCTHNAMHCMASIP